MPENRDALLLHYHTLRKDLLAAIAGLSDDDLVEPSLDGWSVKDHLAHIACWDELRTSEILRISAGYESVSRLSPEQESAFNTLGFDLRRSLPFDQVMWELETSRRRLLEAIAAATSRGLEASLYGEAVLRSIHEVSHAAWIRAGRATHVPSWPPQPNRKSKSEIENTRS